MHRFIFFFLAVSMLPACIWRSKPGCTDPAALNFDPEANEFDGSCTYQSDSYTGNYIARDTLRYTDPNGGGPVMIASGTSFAIERLGPNSVLLRSFMACDLSANVSETSLVLTSNDMCGISGFVCTRQGSTLRYHFSQWNGVEQAFSGVAVRQE